MEQYLLTQEDIDRLGITGVMAGEPATEDELRALFPAQMNERDQLARQALLSSMDMPATVSGTAITPTSMQAKSKLPIDESEILPPDVPVAQQITGTTAPIVPSAGEDVGAPLQARGIESLLASVATQPAAQDDPYSNLSKTQRRMLAFAALGDAGMALQGLQGTGVRDLMRDFTARADQRRKAQAAQMQQQALQQVFGIGSGGFDTGTVEGIDAAISALSNIAVYNPSMANGLALKIKNLQDQKADLMSEQASVEQGEFLFPKIQDAISYINPQGLVDESGNPIINPSIATRLGRGVSEWLQSQEFQELKGNLNTIKNNYTFENMVKLKKQGVTFGALSENELRQVSELVGQLDPANPQGTFKTLNEIQGFINLDRERRGLDPLDQMDSVSQPMTTDDLTPAQLKRIGYKNG